MTCVIVVTVVECPNCGDDIVSIDDVSQSYDDSDEENESGMNMDEYTGVDGMGVEEPEVCHDGDGDGDN